MKNKLFIGLIALVAFGFTACKDKGPQMAAFNLTVAHEDWGFDKSTKQFFYSFDDLAEVSPAVYNNGNWTICREYFPGTVRAYQVPLPITEYFNDTIWNETHDEYYVHYYSRYTDYRLGVGYVDVQVSYSDNMFNYDEEGYIIPPEDMLFRLQLIY